MQWEDARLCAEAKQRQQECDGCPEYVEMLLTHVGKRIVAGIGLQQAETQQERQRADMGDQEVEVSGPTDLRDAVIAHYKENSRNRHRFPRDHEAVRIVCQ